jgi:hypothetical protein
MEHRILVNRGTKILNARTVCGRFCSRRGFAASGEASGPTGVLRRRAGASPK